MNDKKASASPASRPRRAGVLGVVLFASALHASPEGAAAPQDRTVLDRVYSPAQADRGKRAYTENCRACHGDDLGGQTGPALSGDPFLKDWDAAGLDALFTQIRATMPQQAPATLRDETYLEIVAFLLQENGFPAGPGDLPADPSGLAAIRIVRDDAPSDAAAPDAGLVQVVGCLTRGADRQWALTRTTEPARTRAPQPPLQALDDARARSLGTRVFQLMGAERFEPDDHVGQKLEARGLLIRSPGGDRLNLTSLEMVASTCPE